MVKVLITGGTGFLGKRFIERLSKNHDNLEIIISLRNNSRDHYIKGHYRIIYNEINKEFIFDEQVDILIHIAAEIYREKEMWNTNYSGTKRILHWGVNAGIKKIIYVSSVSVFGNNNDTNISENSECLPVNVYDKSKYAAENLITNICTDNKIKYLILRPTNIIDNEISLKYPMLNLIRSIRKEYFYYFCKPENIHLNYVTLDDVINCLTIMIDHNNNGIYILNNPVKTNELVNLVSKQLNVKSPKKIIPYNVGYNLAKLCDLIGIFIGKKMPFNSNVFFELTNQKVYDGTLILKKTKFEYNNSVIELTKKLAIYYEQKGLL